MSRKKVQPEITAGSIQIPYDRFLKLEAAEKELKKLNSKHPLTPTEGRDRVADKLSKRGHYVTELLSQDVTMAVGDKKITLMSRTGQLAIERDKVMDFLDEIDTVITELKGPEWRVAQ